MSRTIVQTIDLQNAPSEVINKYITKIDEYGITIHPETLTGTTSIQLDGTGLDIIKGTISIAKYGDIIRIGQLSTTSIQLDETGLDIFKNGNSIAKYSDVVRIGKGNETRIEIDYHSFKQKDDVNNDYVYFSDLRDRNGYATFTDTFNGDGTTKKFTLRIYVGNSTSGLNITSEDITVTVDGVEKAFNEDYRVETINLGTVRPPIPYSNVRFNTAPPADSTIIVTYRTNSDRAKAFTIGSRAEVPGAHSWTLGYQSSATGLLSYAEGARTQAIGQCSHAQNQDTIAQGDYQTVIGFGNIPDTTSAFIIGNSQNKVEPSNALTIDWNGNIVTRDLQQVRDVAPTSNVWRNKITFTDQIGQIIAYIRTPFLSNGNEGIQLETVRKINGTNKYNGVSFYLDSAGTASVALTQPAAWRTALGLNKLLISVVGKTAKNASAVAANTNFTVDVACAAPAGYQVVGIGAVVATGTNLSRGFDLDGYGIGGTNTVHTYWRTVGAITANSVTVTVQIMCLKVQDFT